MRPVRKHIPLTAITILSVLVLLLSAMISPAWADELTKDNAEPAAETVAEPVTEPPTEPVTEPVKRYKVTFYDGERAVDTMDIAEDGSIEELPVTPAKENAVFRGWFTDDGQAFRTGTVVRSDLAYYARFTEQAAAVFLVDGAVYERQEFEKNGTPFNPVIPNEPKKSGYVFRGWFKDASYLERANFEEEYLTDSADYYARFISESELMGKITFIVDGSVYQEKTYEKDGTLQKVKAPETPTREGYQFSGWFQDQARTTKVAFPVKVKEDATYYGTFVAEGTIYFRLDGQIYKEQLFPLDGTAYKLKEPEPPEKEGFVFDGWYADAGFTKRLNFPVRIKENTILYGKFTREGFVRFFVEDELYEEREFLSTEAPYKVKPPEDPKKEGYVFDGWYTDEALEHKAEFPVEVSRNVKYYGRFSEAPPEEDTGGRISAVTVLAIAEGAAIVVLIVLLLLKRNRKNNPEHPDDAPEEKTESVL